MPQQPSQNFGFHCSQDLFVDRSVIGSKNQAPIQEELNNQHIFSTNQRLLSNNHQSNSCKTKDHDVDTFLVPSEYGVSPYGSLLTPQEENLLERSNSREDKTEFLVPISYKETQNFVSVSAKNFNATTEYPSDSSQQHFLNNQFPESITTGYADQSSGSHHEQLLHIGHLQSGVTVTETNGYVEQTSSNEQLTHVYNESSQMNHVRKGQFSTAVNNGNNPLLRSIDPDLCADNIYVDTAMGSQLDARTDDPIDSYTDTNIADISMQATPLILPARGIDRGRELSASSDVSARGAQGYGIPFQSLDSGVLRAVSELRILYCLQSIANTHIGLLIATVLAYIYIYITN